MEKNGTSPLTIFCLEIMGSEKKIKLLLISFPQKKANTASQEQNRGIENLDH